MITYATDYTISLMMFDDFEIPIERFQQKGDKIISDLQLLAMHMAGAGCYIVTKDLVGQQQNNTRRISLIHLDPLSIATTKYHRKMWSVVDPNKSEAASLAKKSGGLHCTHQTNLYTVSTLLELSAKSK